MKIIIIGAGVAGLSTYLFLKKHLPASLHNTPITIKILEAYDIHKLNTTTAPISEPGGDEPVFTPAAIGNALGLNQNGLRVLDRLDGGVLGRVCARGNTVTGWRMSNARGWTLADVALSPEAEAETESEPESGEREGGFRARDLMIARQDLWEVLRDEVVRDGDVVELKKVSGITIGDGKSRCVVTFEDGSSEEADLVVGADGLRSVLRRAMFESREGDGRKQTDGAGSGWWGGNRSTKSKDYITPQYEGLGGVGGFIPTKNLQNNTTFDPKIMNIVFGPNGFFGYGCISSSSTPSSSPGTVSAWWSTFSSPIPYPYHSQPASNHTAKKSSFDQSRAMTDLLKRHKFWQNPTIQNILEHAESTGLTSMDYYPTWTTPELPCWSKNGVAVLVGDAAHALQPSSGQGASQALEDAETLALLLAHYLRHIGEGQEVHDATQTALKKYEGLRMPRLHMIYERSQKMGKMKANMGFFMEMLMYFFIWVFSLMHDKQIELLRKYDLPKEVKRVIQEDDTAYRPPGRT